jgi:hypothetical protein
VVLFRLQPCILSQPLNVDTRMLRSRYVVHKPKANLPLEFKVSGVGVDVGNRSHVLLFFIIFFLAGEWASE